MSSRLFFVVESMASRTVTQQVVAQPAPKASRRVFFHMKLKPNGDPDGDDPSGSPDSSPRSASPSKLLDCEGGIVNVYMSFRIVTVLKKKLEVNGKKYHMISTKNKDETVDDIKAVLDPVEFLAYRHHFFDNDNHILIEATADNAALEHFNTKTGVVKPRIVLVRCGNDSLHFILEQNITSPSRALDRYKYHQAKAPNAKPTTVSRKQTAMNAVQHNAFEREGRTVLDIKAELAKCAKETPNECQGIITRACDHDAKDPQVLKQLYRNGRKIAPQEKKKAWDEVCEAYAKKKDDHPPKPSGPRGRSGHSRQGRSAAH